MNEEFQAFRLYVKYIQHNHNYHAPVNAICGKQINYVSVWINRKLSEHVLHAACTSAVCRGRVLQFSWELGERAYSVHPQWKRLAPLQVWER